MRTDQASRSQRTASRHLLGDASALLDQDLNIKDAYMQPSEAGTEVSSPPSSSPVTVTPPDCLAGAAELDCTDQYGFSRQLRVRKPVACPGSIFLAIDDTSQHDKTWKPAHSPVSPFLQRLDRLLYAAQQKQRLEDSILQSASDQLFNQGRLGSSHPSTMSIGSQHNIHDLGATASNTTHSPSRIRKRSMTQHHPSVKSGVDNPARDLERIAKKRKLGKIGHSRSRSIAEPCSDTRSTGLSGAFRLRYAKGPGSLRRAESLRSKVHTAAASAEEMLNEVIEHATVQKQSRIPQDLPIIVGSVASPFGGYAPTVPTTPTANDHALSTKLVTRRLSSSVPVIAPPVFELIPRAPLSVDEAGERRVACLLEREMETRQADGLYHATECASFHTEKRAEDEDEEERFWMEDPNKRCDESDAEAWAVEEQLRVGIVPSPLSSVSSRRTLISSCPIELHIDNGLLEQVIPWFLDVMPDDDHKTSYSPGDLYDLLANSPETRFHAAQLFMRYVFLADPSSVLSSASENLSSAPDGELEALEAVIWDTAVACLALSVKFHRDVLFPLDVVYAYEFIDIAPHEMEFDDLESAQRDVLAAVSYRIGSTTPSAFMEELWLALPTLRRILSFDAGWEDAQQEAWVILLDAVQRPDSLQYPVSLVTGVAVIEGLLEIMSRRFKSTGLDGRGRSVRKRDLKTLRKVAIECSQGVRLDIQDVLKISDEELLACRRWLGLCDG